MLCEWFFLISTDKNVVFSFWIVRFVFAVSKIEITMKTVNVTDTHANREWKSSKCCWMRLPQFIPDDLPTPLVSLAVFCPLRLVSLLLYSVPLSQSLRLLRLLLLLLLPLLLFAVYFHLLTMVFFRCASALFAWLVVHCCCRCCCCCCSAHSWCVLLFCFFFFFNSLSGRSRCSCALSLSFRVSHTFSHTPAPNRL